MDDVRVLVAFQNLEAMIWDFDYLWDSMPELERDVFGLEWVIALGRLKDDLLPAQARDELTDDQERCLRVILDWLENNKSRLASARLYTGNVE